MITTILESVSLSEIVTLLTRKLQEGFLLHGSQTAGVTTLTPRASYDAFRDETYTAVFATDQPLIALIRAIAGQRLTGWTRQTVFIVKQLPEVASGYVYLIDAAHAVQNPQDKAEYHYYEAVDPVECIHVINCTECLELLRTQVQDTESVTVGDMKAALLTIRSMIERIGYIDHAFDTDRKYPLVKRLEDLCYRLEAVIQAIVQCRQEDVAMLANEVYGLYDRYTQGGNIYELAGWDPMLDLSVERIDGILKTLK